MHLNYRIPNFLNTQESKFRRVPCIETDTDVNVSRALGNIGHKAISQKPKVSVFQVKPEDIVLFGCDGVFDVVTNEREFINKVINQHKWKNLTKAIVDYAYEAGSMDNISALAIRVDAVKEKVKEVSWFSFEWIWGWFRMLIFWR